MITTANATRRGTRDHNCDGAHTWTTADGTTHATVIDGTGDSRELAHLADVAAVAVSRIADRRSGLAGLLTAADLLGDDHTAAAVTATVSSDGGVQVCWIGDCRAWWWDGSALRQLTTDHTMGQLLRVSGGYAAEQVAASQDHWLRLSLAEATPVTVAEVRALDADDTLLTEGHLLLLTSDGVHQGGVPLAALTRLHAKDPQRLADVLVAAAQARDDGYRDDATVVVIAA
ncbi:hypothetical protein [Micromonospora sp. HUAS LYJ1]|uniref:hypothetical protein n=1 Tax=Micromonospora sp. HUAS LYJ1 TaxID=3061626 RepID=UPI0026736FC2|nr:hypothetical protein [Micromonospora sp. HUAS LYJ1]WKU03772.1 hypothetical protein Q2K16_23450 [Micromonospora sp. HUAS LYJ1]